MAATDFVSEQPTPDKPYSKVRKLLHWLSALVILWATLSGFGVTALAPDQPLRMWVEAVNPQITTLFTPLFLWRLGLYLRSGAGRAFAQRSLQEKLASLAHGALYFIIASVLLTGILMMTHPVVLLAIVPLPQLVHSATALTELHALHHLACGVLALLVLLHLAAVLQHQLKGRSVLERML